MAYIPTIHTFQDDVEENRNPYEAPIEGGVNDIVDDSEVLAPSTELKSSTKILLISISVFFILASIGAVGYYFYNQKQIAAQQALQNEQALKNAELTKKQQGALENIKGVFPALSLNTKIGTLIESATFKDNIITIKISRKENGESSYPEFYALILANEKDFDKDLVRAFNLKDLSQDIEVPVTTISTTTATTSTTTIVNKKKVTKIIEIVATTSTTTLIASTSVIKITDINDVTWSDKTTENQNYKIANLGVSALVYGYVGTDFLVITTNIKDFLDTAKNLQK